MEKKELNEESQNHLNNKLEEKKYSKGYNRKSSIAVSLRNTFFFMMYRYASLVFITSILTFVSSVWLFIFFLTQPVPPQYIPINEDGTYINLLPVDDCNSKTEAEVKTFALDAINRMYKYDYINYSDQFQDAAAYFTTSGWNEYLESYKKSGTLLGVKENKWVVTVKPLGLPEYTRKPIVQDDACTWELKVPIMVSYIGNNTQQINGELYLRISRVSVLKNQMGLGIKKVIFKPI